VYFRCPSKGFEGAHPLGTFFMAAKKQTKKKTTRKKAPAKKRVVRKAAKKKAAPKTARKKATKKKPPAKKPTKKKTARKKEPPKAALPDGVIDAVVESLLGKPIEKHAGGRPTSYDEELLPRIEELYRTGLTDIQMAAVLGVCPATIYNWRRDHPEFLEAQTLGKDIANQKVRRALFERACGFVHPEVHISTHEGFVTQTDILKQYPPDTSAGFIWLKNRGSKDPETNEEEMWSDKQEVEHSGSVESKVIYYPQKKPEGAPVDEAA